MKYRTEITLVILVFLSASYFFQGGEGNENARFDQIRSLALDGSLYLDDLIYNTGDLIVVHGKTFPNKPPLTTFLGIMVWPLAFNLILKLGYLQDKALTIANYLTCLFVSGGASAALALMLYRTSLSFLKEKFSAYFLAIAYSLGSIAYPFSTLFFSHQLTAALPFFAFAVLYLRKEKSYNHIAVFLVILSGFAMGLSFSSEYTAIFSCVPITLYGIIILPRKHILSLLIGIFCGGLVLVTYNLTAFGEIFFLTHQAYSTMEQVPFPDHLHGFLGAHLPTLSGFRDVLFSSDKGLLTLNPWFILAIPGTYIGIRDKSIRLEIAILVVITTAFLVFNAGFGENLFTRGGGYSIGPRYIIPMLPFLTLLVGFCLRSRFFTVIFTALVLFSIAVMSISTAVEPRLPPILNPIFTYYLPLYIKGELGWGTHLIFNEVPDHLNSSWWNGGSLIGLPLAYSLLPLFFIQSFLIGFGVPTPRLRSRVWIAASTFFLLLGLPPILG